MAAGTIWRRPTTAAGRVSSSTARCALARAPKHFLLGLRDKGLWVGSYVGRDYWFSGKIDEVCVSDCVRYDPEQKLAVGARLFDMPGPAAVPRTVRKPTTTGKARLSATFENRSAATRQAGCTRLLHKVSQWAMSHSVGWIDRGGPDCLLEGGTARTDSADNRRTDAPAVDQPAT